MFQNQNKEIDFDVLVTELKDMYDKLGSLSYYIFGIKYGAYLQTQDVNLTKLVRSAGLTESMSKELYKGKRIYEILSKGEYGLSLIKDDVTNHLSIRNRNGNLHSNSKIAISSALTEVNNIFLTAIRTKPFILLAGISGTGKSRIVREFAFKSCPEYLQDKKGITPGNYCMIEVKPNWHDSTELLGYYSNLSGKYQFTKFVRFLVKASMFPDVPFFVCLDEMNLAPVEQYFAEVLSILETRQHPKDAVEDEEGYRTVMTDPIIDAQHFRRLSIMDNVHNMQTGQPCDQGLTDREIYMKLFDIATENDIKEDVGNRKELTEHGLSLPDNVVIIGTVNMDDTTHQFSRKVIDRALTIEMNGGNLRNMFGGSHDLEYPPEAEQKNWQQAFARPYVTADEVIEKLPETDRNELKKTLPARLEEINKALKGTPFEVSYRVLNELTIMAGVMLDNKEEGEELKDIIEKAVDNILLMKILPRIEGDTEMFALSGEYKGKKGVTYDNRLEWLKDLAPDMEESSKESTAKAKIEEMIDRLNNQEFTRFWP